jgi:hypothetical protein
MRRFKFGATRHVGQDGQGVIAHISSRINRWVEAGKLHFAETAEGSSHLPWVVAEKRHGHR